jgi:hypothetical protein
MFPLMSNWIKAAHASGHELSAIREQNRWMHDSRLRTRVWNSVIYRPEECPNDFGRTTTDSDAAYWEVCDALTFQSFAEIGCVKLGFQSTAESA